MVLFVHGWLWDRAGNVAGHVPFEDLDVDFLPAAKALHDAGIPARTLDNTLVKYVQGTGDQWGTMAVVEEFATVTPKVAGPVIRYPSVERYTGYLYISECVDEVVGFFSENL